MTAIATDDSWMETCLIAISPIDGADTQFASITETVDFDIGEKDIEGVPLLNGGRMTKFAPEGDSSITFEAYPLEAGTDSGTEGKGFFDLMHEKMTVNTAQPVTIDIDKTHVVINPNFKKLFKAISIIDIKLNVFEKF